MEAGMPCFQAGAWAEAEAAPSAMPAARARRDKVAKRERELFEVLDKAVS
jgi:hypothetical protein